VVPPHAPDIPSASPPSCSVVLLAMGRERWRIGKGGGREGKGKRRRRRVVGWMIGGGPVVEVEWKGGGTAQEAWENNGSE